MNIRDIIFIILLIAFAFAGNTQTISTKTGLNNENIPPNISQAYRWWNLLHYTINITPDYNKKFITGTNSITFYAIQTGGSVKIDLQQPMLITAVNWKNSPVAFKREKQGYIISFPNEIREGKTETITIHFKGHPQTASNPPFDNGWIWKPDKKGRPWMSIACEGSGASIWLPCKDVLYDEPDKGALFSITVPDSLTAKRLEAASETKSFCHWVVG